MKSVTRHSVKPVPRASSRSDGMIGRKGTGVPAAALELWETPRRRRRTIGPPSSCCSARRWSGLVGHEIEHRRIGDPENIVPTVAQGSSSRSRMGCTTPYRVQMTLVRPLGTIFPVADATMSIVPTRPRTAPRQNSRMMVAQSCGRSRRRRFHNFKRRRQERQLPLARSCARRNG